MVELNIYPHIYFNSWVNIENPLHTTTLIGLHTSSCMICNNLVVRSCMAYQRCFSHITLDNVCKRQVIHNHMTQKSITYGNLHACYVTCDKLQCHTLVVFLSVLRSLASVLWMFSIIIKIHNIPPIHNRSMTFMLFIALNNSLATNMIQNDVLHQG